MMRRALLVAVLLIAGLALAAGAKAKTYIAPKGKVMVGVTGGRTVDGYERAAGKRPAVFQFFVAWGDRFGYAYRRAPDAHAGGGVPTSTYNGPRPPQRAAPPPPPPRAGGAPPPRLLAALAPPGTPVWFP